LYGVFLLHLVRVFVLIIDETVAKGIQTVRTLKHRLSDAVCSAEEERLEM